MPVNREEQQPIMYHSQLPEGNPIIALLGEAGQIALKADISGWQYNLWDNTGWHLCSSQAFYDPPAPVRYIIGYNGSETTFDLEFDEIGYSDIGTKNVSYQKNIINKLLMGQRYANRITRVYLSSSSSVFTTIYLGL